MSECTRDIAWRCIKPSILHISTYGVSQMHFGMVLDTSLYYVVRDQTTYKLRISLLIYVTLLYRRAYNTKAFLLPPRSLHLRTTCVSFKIPLYMLLSPSFRILVLRIYSRLIYGVLINTNNYIENKEIQKFAGPNDKYLSR